MESRNETYVEVLMDVTFEELSNLLPELKIFLRKDKVIPKCLIERGSNGEILEGYIPIPTLF